jgi:hypothetical protein
MRRGGSLRQNYTGLEYSLSLENDKSLSMGEYGIDSVLLYIYMWRWCQCQVYSRSSLCNLKHVFVHQWNLGKIYWHQKRFWLAWYWKTINPPTKLEGSSRAWLASCYTFLQLHSLFERSLLTYLIQNSVPYCKSIQTFSFPLINVVNPHWSEVMLT